MDEKPLGPARYGRYTGFCFEANDQSPAAYDRARVRDFWEKVGVPSASAQDGWRGLMIVESTETPGRLRTLTLWESKEAFDRYFTGQAHRGMGPAFRELGLKIDERDGFEVLFEERARGAVLRLIRAPVRPGRKDEVAAFWRSAGRSIIERQPGCRGVDAYWGAEGSLFVLAVEWRSPADVERFMASEEHLEFIAGLGDAVGEVADRQVLERIT